MDELELDLNEDPNLNRTEERIKNLSSKAKEAYSERDEAKAKADEAEAARLSAEKERDFYQSFSTHAAKFPQATEHMDAIKEKVMAGYAPEDAIVSVLNTEGKLSPQEAVQAPVGQAAGGSAATNVAVGDRPAGEMSREEMRQALLEADSRGELADAIRNIRS